MIQMFIGHFAIAYILWYFFPGIPLWILLTSVSFPDLLWPLLVLFGKEKVIVDKKSPFQRDLIFQKYPYSHSLILSSVFYTIPAAILAYAFHNIEIFPVFLVGTASHWVLDVAYHMHDLPVKGFGKDIKVGLKGWKNGPISYVLEMVFYIIISVLFIPRNFLLNALLIGVIFHVANANSFFGFIKKNAFGGSKGNALMVLVGYLLFIILGSGLIH